MRLLAKLITCALPWLLLSEFAIAGKVYAEGESVNASTGQLNGSIMGNNNQHATDTGIAVNGNTNGANLNNNQTSNTNVLQPIMVSQPYTQNAGQGGSSALILPRNPLPMPNAALGRSNFGLQFGVQNNPGISTITNGKESGLGWFMQGGLTIPFGKIPSMLANPRNSLSDQQREARMDADRRAFGELSPTQDTSAAVKRVQGKVVSLNAYNYTTQPAGRLLPPASNTNIGEIVAPQPRVLALSAGDVYDSPLGQGSKIGAAEKGKEYLYLGHIRSGWVKILLPNGKEGWSQDTFEYLKFDYTEVDDIALARENPAGPTKPVASAKPATTAKFRPARRRISHAR